MHFVPSLFGEFISAIEKESWTFPDLRWLIFSGEALPMSFIQKWIDCYGLKTGLANLYGPTEASIDVTYHIITERPDERTSSQIPIGKAIDNVYLKVLDDQMQSVKQGEMGELWLGGVQLALGYLKDPEKTAKAFCSNPFSDVSGDYIYRTGDLVKELPDGTLEYHGRIDNMVKIRGFRIELGEIESILTTHPNVREAAVLAIDYGEGQKRLIACLSGDKIKNRVLKAHLEQKLPHYMIPQRFAWFPQLAKNHNGKLDRKALAAELLPSPAAPSAPPTPSLIPLGPAQRWLVNYFEPPYQWLGYTRFLYHQSLNLDIFNQAANLLVQRLDILTAVKRTVIPKPHDLGFCFFPLRGFAPALTDLLCSGLMVALQTDTASPAAKIFLLALISRSWCVPQFGQSHSRTFNGIFSAIYPQLLHRLELGNHLSTSM
jgi:hypothetical protein